MKPRACRTPRSFRFWFVVAGVAPLLVFACGPYFPNSLLLSGDNAVLGAPAVRFARELDRLRLEPPPRLPVPLARGTEREVTVDAEILDLRRALGARGVGSNEIAEGVLAFSRSRADLEDYRRAVEAWSAPAFPWLERETNEGGEGRATGAVDRPELRMAELPAGLPREFAGYLRGAAAWHEGRTNAAREAWDGVLALPAAERQYKSTWAAFMLGRSWLGSEPTRALEWFDRTRRLARAGFADSAGLAIASLGWEGQIRLRSNDYSGALRAYLDQYAGGSTNAALSLRVAASRVVQALPEERLAVAGDPLHRRVVTAWVLSACTASHDGFDEPGGTSPTLMMAEAWLDTVEATGAGEAPLAEQLCVLAYQAGQWLAAERWADLSGDSPVADWIRAKLRLREGKVVEAAEGLSRVVARIPLEAPKRAAGEPPEFVDSLFETHDERPGRNQAWGELGVLRVARGEYVQALDVLLRAGFWQDAAYIAERILTVSELRGYVDGAWPVLTGATAEAEAKLEESEQTRRGQRVRIRHLLARRLNRMQRGPEAVGYFPSAWQPVQVRFLDLIRRGRESGAGVRERAGAWFEAAWLARTNGMELLASEMAPDWAIWGGEFEQGPTHALREANAENSLLRARPEEIRRASEHGTEPDRRFHYRYAAGRLAWEAAALLPNNDPETARVLWTAGRWLKARDPEFADLFYKALVRRCRKTELGDAADRQRWFPELDEAGRPVVTRQPRPLAPVPDPVEAEVDATEPTGAVERLERLGEEEPVETDERPE